MPGTVSIVVPTYREAANLPSLVRRVHAALSGAAGEWELILVDDDSDDDSAAVAAELAQRWPVRLHTRSGAPKSLSLSVLLGIGLARFDRVVVMDADLSHPPEQIGDLLAALEAAGCDMAIGSRYVPGARVDPAWSRRRALLSRVGTLLARPLTHCRDPLSGFFAVRRRRLPAAHELRPVGYKIALELMVRGRLRVRDVPIRFSDRGRGHSKMGWRTQLDFVRHLGRLYGYRFWNMLRERA